MNPLYQKEPLDVIAEAVQKALKLEIERIINEEAEAAGKRVIDRVRFKAGEISAGIASYVDYQRFHDRMVITVKINSKD